MGEYSYKKNELTKNKMELLGSEEERKAKKFKQLNNAIQLRSESQMPQKFKEFESHGYISRFFGAQEVSADEMNNFISQLQQILIDFNKELNRNKNTFGIVYETFKFLDSEYIKGILVSQASANKANEKARDAIEGLQKSQTRLDKHQKEIDKIIENNNKILKVLVKQQDELKKIKHLKDVDKFVNYVDSLLKSMDKTKERINKIANEIATIEGACQESIDFLNEKIDENNNEIDEKIKKIDIDFKEIVQIKEDDLTKKINDVEEICKNAINSLNEKFDEKSHEIDGKLKKIDIDFKEIVQVKEDGLTKKINDVEEVCQNSISSLNNKIDEESKKISKDFFDYKEFAQEKEINMKNEFEKRTNTIIKENNIKHGELVGEIDNCIEKVNTYSDKFNKDIKEIHTLINTDIQNQITDTTKKVDVLNNNINDMSSSLKTIRMISIGSVVLNIILIIVIFMGVL